MTIAIDPVELAKALIACPSVTPARGAVFDILANALQIAGFQVDRFVSEDAAGDRIENLFASRGSGAPRFAFAGHLDVVPGGPDWSGDPFAPEVRGGLLYGRGAVDMKGAVAAFVAATALVEHGGTLSLIVTGDEEGAATHGTRALIDWMEARAIVPDAILVGEPTCEARLGDTIKIGRRGSVNMWIDVPGTEGHVAYPHLVDNPLRKLGPLLDALHALPLDEGNEWFEPSNLEVTDIAVGNSACNVIPSQARLRLNIRFNNIQQGSPLIERVRDVVDGLVPGATLKAAVAGEAFLSPPSTLVRALEQSILAETNCVALSSTSGGTSDARFLSKLCPVAEFGLVNATMHKRDEAVAVEDLQALARIYAAVIARMLPLSG